MEYHRNISSGSFLGTNGGITARQVMNTGLQPWSTTTGCSGYEIDRALNIIIKGNQG